MYNNVIKALVEDEDLFRSLPNDLSGLCFRTISIKRVNESDLLFGYTLKLQKEQSPEGLGKNWKYLSGLHDYVL